MGADLDIRPNIEQRDCKSTQQKSAMKTRNKFWRPSRSDAIKRARTDGTGAAVYDKPLSADVINEED